MKRYSILFLMVACVLSGCSREAFWEFQYGPERVSKIKLVDMIDDIQYSIIEEIDVSCAGQLFSDINKLDWERYGPNLSTPRDICFLIVYDSGEYDVVSFYEPKHYRFENGDLFAYNSWLRCDYDDFQKLLNQYR